MTYSTLKTVNRPIKLGFLLTPHQSSSLRTAIQCSTNHWGGAHFPLIPKPGRRVLAWKDTFDNPYTANDITNGYIDYFDPDFLVNIDPNGLFRSNSESRRLLNHDEIIDAKRGNPLYGIGILEIAAAYFEKEMKFVRRNVRQFIRPIYSSRYSMFFDSVFGSLEPKMEASFSSHFMTHLEIKEEVCDFSNYLSFLDPNYMFLRRLGQNEIEYSLPNRDQIILLIMDASSNQDIIDYWNIRASGYHVIPVATQCLTEQSSIEVVLQYIKIQSEEENAIGYQPSANLIKGRSLSEEQFKASITLIQKAYHSKNAINPRLSIQSWYPPMWRVFKGGASGYECVNYTHSSKTISFNEKPTVISFETAAIPRDKGPYHFAHAYYATELEYSSYSFNDMHAEVIPEFKTNFAPSLSPIHPELWRFSRKNIVRYVQYTNSNVQIDLPTSEEVFSSWLKESGWTFKLSPPGKAAIQMSKNLGGILGAAKLNNKYILGLLENMSGGKAKTFAEINSVYSRISNEIHKKTIAASDLISGAVYSNILTLGLKIKCDKCEQNSWYPLDGLDYKLKCPKCYSEFIPPLHNPTLMNWAYQTAGTFSLPDRAQGIYTTLLAIRFFKLHTHSNPDTTVFSFISENNGIQIETDFAMMFRGFRRAIGNERQPRIMFAECKSFNDFKADDVNKMRIISDNFPGSYLLFATLKDDLSPVEKKIIKSIAKRGRRKSFDGRPHSSVIILTGEQIFSKVWPPEDWIEFRSNQFQRQYGETFHDKISDVTLQKFLGLEPLSEWSNNMFRHKNKLRPTLLNDDQQKGQSKITA